MKTQIEIDEREKDIKAVCNGVVTADIIDNGDSGAWCPFCYKSCRWDAEDVSQIEHEPSCIYLIAKDLLT